MSNRKLIDPSIVTGIADAIRTKKGTTATIKVSELADEIASIPTGGMADSTKELVQVVSGVTPTDEISLNNGIASGVVDAPSVQSWKDTRTTADGGTIKDGIAYVKALRGKSIKVAQMLTFDSNMTSKTSKGITFDWSRGDGSLHIYGTATEASANTNYITPFKNLNIPSGHKVLLRMSPSNTNFTCKFIGLGYAGEFYADADRPTLRAATYGMFRTAFVFAAGATIDETYYPFVLDLTEMGIDTLTTADAVAQYLGYASAADLPYIAPTNGTIVLNSKQKSVSSYGRNLWDEEWVVGLLNLNGTFNGATTDRISSKNYIEVKGGATICKGLPNSIMSRWCIYDESKTLISSVDYGTATTFVLPSNARYVKFSTAGAYGNTYNNDICVEYGSTAHGYEPHRAADTLTLPTLTAFPHGLCSNGTTYDEVILSEGKAYKRIADDGTILDTPQEVTFTPCRAYYKASNNGQEVATADTATAPFTAEIGYKEPTATELVNATSI